MNVLRSGIVTMLLLAAFSVQAACTWPAWEQFKKDYISQEGRVIDPSDARKITTSEGQSYGMFFALAANDRVAAADAGAVFHPLWRAVDHAARNQSTFIAGNRPERFFARLGAL